jgi:hypothetical protein
MGRSPMRDGLRPALRNMPRMTAICPQHASDTDATRRVLGVIPIFEARPAARREQGLTALNAHESSDSAILSAEYLNVAPPARIGAWLDLAFDICPGMGDAISGIVEDLDQVRRRWEYRRRSRRVRRRARKASRPGLGDITHLTE